MCLIRTLAMSIFLVGISLSTSASENAKQHFEGIGLYEYFYGAIEMDSAEEIKQFIIFGADVNHRYEGGKTPLMLAASLGNLKSVYTLIELGAKVELKSDDDMTAFDYAGNNGQISTLVTLQNSSVPQQNQSYSQIITTIQFYLNRLGYVAGDLDGVYGKKTRASLKQFTKDTKQAFPAEISERQIEALFNIMSASASAKIIKPNPDADIEDYTETVPSNTTKDLATTVTETDSALR